MIELNTEYLVKQIDFESYRAEVEKIHHWIDDKTGEGSDFLGWVNYPDTYDQKEFARIERAAQYIQLHYDVLVVCGIGGSYLGARAAIEALNGLHPDSKVEIIFMGHTTAPSYISQVLKYLKGKRFAINCISKSGTTTETAIAFRLLREMLIEQAGEEASKRAITVTTDKESGALVELAKKYGYERFVLPDDIGGRYSVFSAVGLLPMAAAGINIRDFMRGAKEALDEYDNPDIATNAAYQYAVIRHEMYTKEHKSVELFVSYEPKLVQLAEWWKQLFAESEGKGKSGLLPDAVTFTTDLHSLGQFIQDGSPCLFETVLMVKNPAVDVILPGDEDNLDGLNYLEGKTLSEVTEKAMQGTLMAHSKTGGVPNLVIYLKRLNARSLGYLMYFYMRACAMSAYLNGVNPFNQPGVEIYKKNMFHLLGKPGYEK
ncbi:MAG: glucose-6-phosphate isomerase [Bacillota bacterium]|nr:glucose-6-phosphate isomerase [Bacillota bacterium]